MSWIWTANSDDVAKKIIEMETNILSLRTRSYEVWNDISDINSSIGKLREEFSHRLTALESHQAVMQDAINNLSRAADMKQSHNKCELSAVGAGILPDNPTVSVLTCQMCKHKHLWFK